MAENDTGRTDDQDERLADLDEATRKIVQSETDRVRTKYVQQLKETQAAQAGSDRKVRELTDEIAALREQLGVKNTEDSKETKQLLEDLAEFRAQKALISRQAETLQKAAEGKIPLDVAIEFAKLDNAPDLIVRLSEIIEDRANVKTNERLLQDSFVPTTGDDGKGEITWADIQRMSPEEQKRLPQRLIDRAIERAG